VVRSEFDHLLLEHAKSQGVQVFEGIEVQSLSFDGDRPRSATWASVAEKQETGEISFDFLVDASGRAGIMAMHYLKSRHYHSAFQNVALWGYWTGAKQLTNAPKGAIAVGSVQDGWIWGIPLHNGTMSVGLVTHKTTFKEKRQQSASLEQIYLEAIDACPLIKGLVESGELVSKISAEQDYSYLSDVLSGPGYFLGGMQRASSIRSFQPVSISRPLVGCWLRRVLRALCVEKSPRSKPAHFMRRATAIPTFAWL